MSLFSNKIYLPERVYNHIPHLSIMSGLLFFALDAPVAFFLGISSICYGLWVIAQRKSPHQTVTQKARSRLSGI